MATTTTKDAATLGMELLQAFGNGDIEGLLALHADDCVWEHYAVEAGLRGRYEGHAGIQQHLGNVQQKVDLGNVKVDGIVGDGKVAVALLQISATARPTGRSFGGPEVVVFTARDGLLTRMQVFPSEGDAPWRD